MIHWPNSKVGRSTKKKIILDASDAKFLYGSGHLAWSNGTSIVAHSKKMAEPQLKTPYRSLYRLTTHAESKKTHLVLNEIK
jgi:hypothetical protein